MTTFLKEDILLLSSVFILSLLTTQACNHTCGSQQFPYPFGFSSNCPIHLNCTQEGQILINQLFPVQMVNQDTIRINLEPNCNRSIQAFKNLYTRNFAPKSTNAILLLNCHSTVSSCLIPAMSVKNHFESLKCSNNSGMNCLSDQTGLFFYRNDTQLNQCQNFWSSISLLSSGALMSQVMELGWWLLGDCHCSENANCARSKTPQGLVGYRCQCGNEFEGDGYAVGAGCRMPEGDKSNKPIKLGIGLGTTATVAAIFIISLGGYSLITGRGFWSGSKNTKQEKNTEAFIVNYHSLMPKRYSYSDIKKIRNSFADKLGQGGFGSVYGGKLKDGRCVAVKVLNKSIGEGEEFINEVASISRTSHVNVVTLAGFCYERTKRALIYEYMPNGSLDKFIYDLGNQLESKMLYDIAIGIARGLEYLHQGCNTRIVHFDIKPQNVLLDEDFCPKISDFGLAKLCKRKESIMSMLSARGTIGYIAPEVFMRSLGGASYKSDVYSYGMMILEMFGRRSTSDIKASEGSEMYFPDELYKYLEPGKNSSMNENVIEGDEGEMVRRMIIIGLWCIQTNPSDRPSMTKVIEMLEGSLQSLQIPPKPVLFSATTPTVEVEYSSTLSSAADMIADA